MCTNKKEKEVNMELKEGMYARTELGSIFKVEIVIEYDKNGKWYNGFKKGRCLKVSTKNINNYNVRSRITKASYNIVDLIKKGDILLGREKNII